MKKVCFIGHRVVCNNDIRDKLYAEIKRQIEKGYKFFTMGTHGDFDNLALSVCRELRRKYKFIEIEVVITSINQIKQVVDYDPIFGVEKYMPYNDVKTVMYDIEEEFYKRRIIVSNKKMIDNCDTMICYVNNARTSGGAVLAYKYAKKKGLQIVNLIDC